MLTAQKEDIVPDSWYNIVPDLPEQMAPPKDNSEEFSSIELLNRIIPKEVLKQEFTFSRYQRIPEEVMEAYRQIGRPTPLVRARNLEKRLDFKGKIYFKYEGATVTGSHKINTAIPQAFYAAQEGTKGISTETGAGQWGTATALASSLYGMPCKVFMVGVSYRQKPLRKKIMGLYGAEVFSSPSEMTQFGSRLLAENSEHPGSLGIAISEAVQYALDNDYRYLLGSVMNSVLTHQSIIGLETRKQLELEGEQPDALIGCVGGGSNFGGFTYPFVKERKDLDMIASTASEIPKFASGEFKYDKLDTAGILPSMKTYSLGADFVPPPIYAGGLRYHAAAPSLSILLKNGIVKHDEVGEKEVKDALRTFSGTQGIVAAPESGHAIASTIRYAKDPANSGKTIVLNVSGHGLLDMSIFEE